MKCRRAYEYNLGLSQHVFSVRKDTLRTAFLLVFVCIMMSIPWEDAFYLVYGYEIGDLTYYRHYFLYEESVLDYAEFDHFIDYITNEFLWHYLIGILVHEVGVPIGYVFGAISLLTIFVFGRIVLSLAGVMALPLIINPLVIDFAFGQFRLALAISLLGIAYLLKDRKNAASVFFVVTSLFIHTASIIFIAIYVCPLIIRAVVKRCKRAQLLELFLLVLLGAFVSMLIGPLREAVLAYIGDRRVSYPDMSSSFKYSLFWIALLIPMFLYYRKILEFDYARYAVVILSLVAVNVFHGGYSTRFLAVTLPFVISSVFLLPKGIRVVSVLFFIIYAALQWLYWLKILGG